ncbi:hypothetical protein [Alterisphingorhabdus coralli]|uniref:DUF1579 domain-containing protein n=1 Tax=Alterisphingorhabdus coralli TaxID=3071408 RepID=A0AA97F7B0_9SPHN|nr:hypothetical protein [Parasphingorhabdus sp. SCSIO 66989]WOE74572.1 hypothetical protein RB602_12045 [Parasphingorhabdus sp. SCSIO 66989]
MDKSHLYFRKALAGSAFTGALLLSFGSTALAQQNSTAATPKPPPPCSTEAHRAFDFWLGEWDVTPAGREAPTAINTIENMHGGCVIRESYSTKGGYSGMSMSFYDAARDIWHQTWMGLDGNALYIEGGVNDAGAMVLSNKNWPGYVEGSPVNRVTWTPDDDGSVRQHWEQSTDGEKTWTTVFDGQYVKRK